MPIRSFLGRLSPNQTGKRGFIHKTAESPTAPGDIFNRLRGCLLEFPTEITASPPATLFGFFDPRIRRENKKQGYDGQQNKTQRPRVRDVGQVTGDDKGYLGLPGCWHTNKDVERTSDGSFMSETPDLRTGTYRSSGSP
ncbi:hypothetical protein FPRO06_13811 [Fusarium proliferatum]|nr:hypothetical protein FPRO06_13811 [Fusarium proliferatum]